jgi:branched-chain amino acid transport system ATP-binding protein
VSSKLEVRQLEKSFAGLKAVDGVNMDLATGEILGLIGPNGSGKTTFVNLLTGLLPETGGSVMIDGVDITRFPAHRVAKAGLARTYQTIRLFRNLEVLENVEVAAVSAGHSRKVAREKSLALLEEVGLINSKDNLAGSLTFASQRRLELARALALEPKFLLLDEPAAGLNEEETVDLLDLFKPMPQTKSIGLLIIDHDMHLMMNLCERLHVLNYGKTIAEGTPEEIRSNPDVVTAYLGGGDDE